MAARIASRMVQYLASVNSRLFTLLKQSDEALRSQTCRRSYLSSTPPSTPSDSSYLLEQVGDFLPSIVEFLNACSAYQTCLASDRHDASLYIEKPKCGLQCNGASIPYKMLSKGLAQYLPHSNQEIAPKKATKPVPTKASKKDSSSSSEEDSSSDDVSLNSTVELSLDRYQ